MFLLFFLYCCTLCMLYILHLIQKHIEDSRSLSLSFIGTAMPAVRTDYWTDINISSLKKMLSD